MQLSRKIIAAAGALAMSLTFVACGNANDTTSQSAGQSAAQSSNQIGSVPVVDRDPKGELPHVELFEDGDEPVITPVEAAPPTTVTVETLIEGDGPAVGPDDYVTVNYVGTLWDGTVFDSSYQRGETAGFSLNALVKGWKYGLDTVPVGSTVLLVIPSSWGYGNVESAGGLIPADSTLVFVIEILDTVSVDNGVLKDATPTDQELPTGMHIESELGVEPVVTFDPESPAPTAQTVLVLAEGSGRVITDADTVIFQMLNGLWGTTEFRSTWHTGAESVEKAGSDLLRGEKVGSRLLILLPAEDASTPAQYSIVDVVAAFEPQALASSQSE